MQTYTVYQLANLPRCDMPGYRQWLQVRDDEDQWCGEWHFESEGTDIVPGCIAIQSKEFRAETSSGAAMQFIDWLESGQ